MKISFKDKNFRVNLFNNILKHIEDEEFTSRCRNGSSGFTRKRKLTFINIIVLLARGIKSSLQRELDRFYREVTGSDFNIREVTKGAFTQARSNLKHEAFIELNDVVNESFYSDAPYLKWRDMRLLSCDGSRLVLPNHKSIIEEFGEHGFGPDANSKRSLAIVSFLYDSLNLLTIDSQIAPYSCSERELLYRHLEKMRRGDLLLIDRGYPGIALFFMLKAKGVEFCSRMKEDWWLAVKDFKDSGEKQRIVAFSLPKKDKKLLEGYPEIKENNIRCRLVRIELDNGEVEILCTSLIDQVKYPYEDFKELYHFRWNIEEGYKLLKARVEIENFSGKTSLAVKQDYFAKVFMMSFCAALAFPIEEKVRKESVESKNKHPQKINRTYSLSIIRDVLIGMFIRKKPIETLVSFDQLVGQTKEIVRSGRSFERKKRPKKLYYMNYKTL